MQHSAPVIFFLGTFFPSPFYAEIQGARSPELLVLSQDPAVGFFWVAGTLTNFRLMLDEKYNLHCWLSPVTDTWRGFGWNFVLKKLLAWKHLLGCVDIPGKAEAALQCVLTNREHPLKQIPNLSTSGDVHRLLGLSRAANGGTSGTQGILFLLCSELVLHKERSHLFPFQCL